LGGITWIVLCWVILAEPCHANLPCIVLSINWRNDWS
jgi:hypothetical protein